MCFPDKNVVSNRNCGKPGMCPALVKNSGDFLLARGDGLWIGAFLLPITLNYSYLRLYWV